MTDILNKLNKFSKIIIGLTAFTITFANFSLLKVHAAPECTPEYKTSASHVPLFARVEMNDCAVKEIVKTSQYSGGVCDFTCKNDKILPKACRFIASNADVEVNFSCQDAPYLF